MFNKFKNLFLAAAVILLTACGVPEPSDHKIQSYVVHQTNGSWEFWHVIKSDTNVFYSVTLSNVAYADTVWYATTSVPSFLNDTNISKLSQVSFYKIERISELVRTGKTEAQRKADEEAAAEAVAEAASAFADIAIDSD